MLPTTPAPFPPGKLLIPVLHLIRPPGDGDDASIAAHVLSQAHLARSCGADGFALCPSERLSLSAKLAAAAAVASAFPTLPLTINFMCGVDEALDCVPPYCHLWTDKGVDSRGLAAEVHSALAARPLAARRAERGWRGVWLAGFFHKGGQRDFSLDDGALVRLAAAVAEMSELPITTGAGTGVAPLPAELARLRVALAAAASPAPAPRLACASGIMLENVGPALPVVDVFFVATGIERATADPAVLDFYLSAGLPANAAVDVGFLDAEKTRALAAAIHAFGGGAPPPAPSPPL
jgi:hypothetical protein